MHDTRPVLRAVVPNCRSVAARSAQNDASTLAQTSARTGDLYGVDFKWRLQRFPTWPVETRGLRDRESLRPGEGPTPTSTLRTQSRLIRSPAHRVVPHVRARCGVPG